MDARGLWAVKAVRAELDVLVRAGRWQRASEVARGLAELIATEQARSAAATAASTDPCFVHEGRCVLADHEGQMCQEGMVVVW